MDYNDKKESVDISDTQGIGFDGIESVDLESEDCIYELPDLLEWEFYTEQKVNYAALEFDRIFMPYMKEMFMDDPYKFIRFCILAKCKKFDVHVNTWVTNPHLEESQNVTMEIILIAEDFEIRMDELFPESVEEMISYTRKQLLNTFMSNLEVVMKQRKLSFFSEQQER